MVSGQVILSREYSIPEVLTLLILENGLGEAAKKIILEQAKDRS